MEKYFAIIDIETTGGRASRDKITEIAIVLHNGEKIIDQFESLINPECPIPYGISEMTGITNEMVSGAPKFYEVARKVVEMTEGAIFVAHNVRFDYCFVQEEFRRLGYTYQRKQLCTVRLARKAFPGFRSYSLDSLIARFNLGIANRHRAMGDALATTELFDKIIEAQNSRAEITAMINMGVRESLLPKNFSMEKLHGLPESCGVYYFHDLSGDVVYVGKSVNIKKRVAEHFADKTEKARKLQQLADDVSWELTGSELTALLLESHEIKRLKPPINRAQKVWQFPFVIHCFYNQAGYLCFDLKKATVKTRKNLQIVAEYSKLSHAKTWLTEMKLRYELCLRHCHLEVKSGACFDFHLQKCHGACIGLEPPELYNLRAKDAMKALDESFPDPNFFILDKGRTVDETTVVLVEDGEYQGFGFLDLDASNGNLQELRDAIRKYDNNPEVKRILRRFMLESGSIKIIKF